MSLRLAAVVTNFGWQPVPTCFNHTPYTQKPACRELVRQQLQERLSSKPKLHECSFITVFFFFFKKKKNICRHCQGYVSSSGKRWIAYKSNINVPKHKQADLFGSGTKVSPYYLLPTLCDVAIYLSPFLCDSCTIMKWYKKKNEKWKKGTSGWTWKPMCQAVLNKLKSTE